MLWGSSKNSTEKGSTSDTGASSAAPGGDGPAGASCKGSVPFIACSPGVSVRVGVCVDVALEAEA